MTLELNNTYIDLSKIKYVTGTQLSAHGGIAIHLFCNEGDEQSLADLLPTIVHREMTIHKGHQQVYLTKP